MTDSSSDEERYFINEMYSPLSEEDFRKRQESSPITQKGVLLPYWLRFHIYGLHGVFIEVLFTAIFDFVANSNRKLPGCSSVWAFLMCGVSGLVQEYLHCWMLPRVPFLIRGFMYVAWMYLWEYATGTLLKTFHACPWNYVQFDHNVHGLITFEYAPLWMAKSTKMKDKVLMKRKRILQNVWTKKTTMFEEFMNPTHPMDVFKEFSEGTALIGVRYIVRDGAHLMDRLMWSLVFLVCLLFAGYFTTHAWDEYLESPIVTTVENTFYPLQKLAFPAITVCPSNSLRRRTGEILLRRYLNMTPSDADPSLLHLMRGLLLLRYPNYDVVREDLSLVTNISRFDGFNITDFMLQTLPPIADIFKKCVWMSQQVSCTDIFHLQRYEGGFCYSFNSLTSDASKNCRTGSDSQGSVKNFFMHRKNFGCKLLRNAAGGTATGLELLLNPPDEADELGGEEAEMMGTRVLWHPPDEFPQAESEVLMPKRTVRSAWVKIFPSVTESSPSLRWISPKKRSCYFPDERTLGIDPLYSQDKCFIECRHRYIMETCHCQLYYFNQPRNNISTCSVPQLSCIIRHSRNLKFMTFPREDTGPGVADCSSCLPKCNEVRYGIDESYVDGTTLLNKTSTGYISIYYGNRYAVKYLREPAMDTMAFLVSFGGIVSLFLGVSLATGVEILYYLARLCRAVYSFYRPRPGNVEPRLLTGAPKLPTY